MKRYVLLSSSAAMARSAAWCLARGSNLTNGPDSAELRALGSWMPPHRSWRWHLAERQVAGPSRGQVPQILWMIGSTVSDSDPNE